MVPRADLRCGPRVPKAQLRPGWRVPPRRRRAGRRGGEGRELGLVLPGLHGTLIRCRITALGYGA